MEEALDLSSDRILNELMSINVFFGPKRLSGSILTLRISENFLHHSLFRLTLPVLETISCNFGGWLYSEFTVSSAKVSCHL